MKLIAALATDVCMRLDSGEVVNAVAFGYSEDGELAYLVATYDVSADGPFWVAAGHVTQHWLERDSVAQPGVTEFDNLGGGGPQP